MTRRALVTGGNRGIGRAIAEGLKAEGLDVFIGVRDSEEGARVAEDIGVRAVALDLERPEQFPDAIAAAKPEVLVNNAGVLHEGSMLDDPAEFAQAMRVMVHAPYELIRLSLPHLGRNGRIVNVSSGWGSFSEGLGGPGAYGVAKAALNALTRALPRDLADGVKINAMCPGWVRTRMGGAGADRSPEEGADTAIWLATLGPDGPTGGFFRDRKAIEW